ncbi:hypothetical protein SUDANB95_07864 (plasmid) [Actinosynnema sp. ALI-1.44]
MSAPKSVHVTVPAVRANVDLTPLLSYLDGEDGKLVEITFHHEPHYPHLSGPVLRYRLPDGRVVRTQPTIEGFDLCWDDTRQEAVIDAGASEVLHTMWDALNTALQKMLLPKFYEEAAASISGAIVVAAVFGVSRDR